MSGTVLVPILRCPLLVLRCRKVPHHPHQMGLGAPGKDSGLGSPLLPERSVYSLAELGSLVSPCSHLKAATSCAFCHLPSGCQQQEPPSALGKGGKTHPSNFSTLVEAVGVWGTTLG